MLCLPQEDSLCARGEACRARAACYSALGAAAEPQPLRDDPFALAAAEVLESAAVATEPPAAQKQPGRPAGTEEATPAEPPTVGLLTASSGALAAAAGDLRSRALLAEQAAAEAAAQAAEAARALERRVDAAAAWAFRQWPGGEAAAGDEDPWAAPYPQLSVDAVEEALVGARPWGFCAHASAWSLLFPLRQRSDPLLSRPRLSALSP